LGTEEVVQLGRDVKVFTGAAWGFRSKGTVDGQDEIVVSVVGRGVGNVGRKVA